MAKLLKKKGLGVRMWFLTIGWAHAKMPAQSVLAEKLNAAEEVVLDAVVWGFCLGAA